MVKTEHMKLYDQIKESSSNFLFGIDKGKKITVEKIKSHEV